VGRSHLGAGVEAALMHDRKHGLHADLAGPGVAAATVFECQVAAKGTLAIVTGEATLAAPGSEMLEG